ncbi:MAG TPA: hypothetical protein VH044_11630 [Polyangiaceae bacterium]|jgi:hypothetical protein|nr:hypothetical protein [Polyangiaceae bacterium]
MTWYGGFVVVGMMLGATAVACSSSSGDGGSVSSDQASGDAANALCQKIDACSSFLIAETYGDAATCASRIKSSFVGSLAASATGATPAHLEACAKAIPAISCDDALGNGTPAACQPVAGHLAAGAACGDSSQCESAYCNVGTDGTCGACAASRASTGDTCNRDDDCTVGAVCNAGKCSSLAAAGATCSDALPCLKTLVCKAGTCATADEAGAPCSTGTCDALAGLFCSIAAPHVCVKIGLAAAGEACFAVNGGGFTACSNGGLCNRAALATTGTCEAPAADGGSCDDTSGPPCMPPAVCSAAKVCTIAAPDTCH